MLLDLEIISVILRLASVCVFLMCTSGSAGSVTQATMVSHIVRNVNVTAMQTSVRISLADVLIVEITLQGIIVKGRFIVYHLQNIQSTLDILKS